VDFDSDGRLDLIQTNGHVLDRARLGIPFAMRPTLLQNLGIPFDDVSARGGAWFQRATLGRGLAVGDLDGDGRPDLVACALDGPAALLRNRSQGGKFLNLTLFDRAGRIAIGARVRVLSGSRIQTGVLTAGGSYLAASEPTIHFGLGVADGITLVEVDWAWGS